MDISQLLGAAFQADIDVKHTESDKTDSEGNKITYTNVNFKQASKVPKKLVVDELQQEPLILNHNNVTADTVKFIRGKVIEMMKKAPEYEGSALQKLIGGNNAASDSDAEVEQEEAPVAKAETKKAPTTVKPKGKKPEAKPAEVDIEEEMPDFSDLEDDSEPF
jgi:hypothetical protein